MRRSNDVELSVIVALVSDTTDQRYDLSHLSGCLKSLFDQVDAPPMEVIVPYPSVLDELSLFKNQYPEVTFLPVSDLKSYDRQGSSREHHDELRARGLLAARGKIIALVEDHARPDSHWANQMVLAHNQEFAAVGGAIENGIDRPLNWAVYFSDFGKYQNPIPNGESTFASDANVSYKRGALESIQHVWIDYFHETEVNWALNQNGEKISLSPYAIVYQHRKDLQFWHALEERYIWGRSYSMTRGKLLSTAKRLLYIFLSPILPGILVLRMTANILRKRRNVTSFIKALPITITLAIAWSLGEFRGYIGGL